MAKHIPLPDDAWADLRDPKKVPEYLRRQVSEASAELGLEVDLEAVKDSATDEAALRILGVRGLKMSNEVNDLAAVALVEKWSFGDTVDLDTLRQLPGDAYDALRVAVAPLVPLMRVNAEPSADPASPSEPSQP